MASLVFVLAALFLLYVLAGYPLLLALLVRLRAGSPIAKRFSPRAVSILLPVRNGERWLREKLASILRLDYPKELLEILVISDGSTDQSEAIAQEFAAQGVRLISVSRGGKAAALNAGLRRAQGEILFFTDVRQQLDPGALRELVACFGDPCVGVASGELFILDGATREEANVGLYWQYEKWIRRRLSRLDSVLGATGCIYAMRRELAVEIPEDTLLDDVYLPLAAFFRGYRVILDESAKAFDAPMSLDTEFRRKVRTLAGVYQLLGQYPKLLGPANRMWVHFVSHKVGRLLLPFSLLAMAVASFWLPDFWANLALGLQGIFYGLAAIDRWIPDRWMLKSLTSPIRTFVAFMAAALAAVSFFFVPSSRFWREAKSAPVDRLIG
jgi:cellulose synthase/poly-beta-1,6-N-acetylglucosamine synthase-like glycosyltransferase